MPDSNSETHLLVVDDKAAMRGLLTDYFTEQGYRVSTAQDGELAMAAHKQDSPDIVLLDLMMPRVDGFEFLKRFRPKFDTPVIVITAKEAETDAVTALELGADDYVIKPIRMKELEARVQAVLRRKAPKPSTTELTFEDVRLQVDTHETFVGSNPIRLTPTEFELLKCLLLEQPKAVSKESLIAELASLGIEGLDSTLKVHIRNLRNKLLVADQDIIQTVFGVGYKIANASGE